MKREIKRKISVSLITIFNLGFLFILTNPSYAEGIENSLAQVVFQSLIVTILVSVTYVAPLILFIALPVSLSIDFLIKKVNHKNLLSFVLHVLAGSIITYILSTVLSLSPILKDLLNVEIFLKWVFILIYPSVFFWIFDYLLKRNNR
jgi:hypothetical protein